MASIYTGSEQVMQYRDHLRPDRKLHDVHWLHDNVVTFVDCSNTRWYIGVTHEHYCLRGSCLFFTNDLEEMIEHSITHL